MNYKLVALDLDGTLLDSRLQVRGETVAALDRLRAQGTQAMIVTGRHHAAAYAYWSELGLTLPAICCNGAYLYDFATQRALAGDPLSRDEARELLELARRHAIHAMVYVHDFMAFETTDPHLEKLLRWASSLAPALRPRIEKVAAFEQLIAQATTIWKFTFACDDLPAMRAFVADVERSLGLGCVWSGNTRIDVGHAGNSKGQRLSEWIAGQGIARAEVIAFGDHQNDIEMLRLAGVGVAMGNSQSVVQACADWVTGSNDSSGIADALHRFVLTPA